MLTKCWPNINPTFAQHGVVFAGKGLINYVCINIRQVVINITLPGILTRHRSMYHRIAGTVSHRLSRPICTPAAMQLISAGLAT